MLCEIDEINRFGSMKRNKHNQVEVRNTSRKKNKEGRQYFGNNSLNETTPARCLNSGVEITRLR